MPRSRAPVGYDGPMPPRVRTAARYRRRRLAALTLFVTVTGVILLWLRLARDLRNLDNRRRRAKA